MELLGETPNGLSAIQACQKRQDSVKGKECRASSYTTARSDKRRLQRVFHAERFCLFCSPHGQQPGGKVYFNELPKEVHQRFNYEPEKATKSRHAVKRDG